MLPASHFLRSRIMEATAFPQLGQVGSSPSMRPAAQPLQQQRCTLRSRNQGVICQDPGARVNIGRVWVVQT